MERSRYYAVLTGSLLLFGFTLPLSKSAGNVLIFLAYLIAAAAILFDENFKRAIVPTIKQPLILPFSLYCLIAFIGVYFTQEYSDGFHVANKFLSLPAIYLMITVLLEVSPDKEQAYLRAQKALLAFLVGLMVLNCIAMMTYLGLIGQKKFILPLAPMSVHHIWFSNINAIGLYTAASFYLFPLDRFQNKLRIFLVSFVVLAILCILLSLSRTAWFGIILTSLIMAFLVSKNKKVFSTLLIAAIVACIALYSMVPIVHERVRLISEDISKFMAGDLSYTSLGGRFFMWKAAIMMFLTNPLTGVGTGGFVPTMAEYIQSGRFPEFFLVFIQPHNMYLFALATNGIPGFAALLFIFYRALKFALPIVKRENNEERLFAFLAAATVVHFMIAGLTDSFFNIQILRYTFIFIMGVCVRTSLDRGSSR